MAIRARFKGDRNPDGSPAEFVEGVPARNIDEDEWAALDTDTRQRIRSSPLYDVKTEKEMHPHKAEDQAAGAAPPDEPAAAEQGGT